MNRHDALGAPKEMLAEAAVLPESPIPDAAHLFHKEASPAAIAFVRRRLLRGLQGQAKSVIADLRSQGTQRGLTCSAKVKLRTLTGFLESNLHRLQYDEYLATGVIEGACRHLAKHRMKHCDRLERSGRRWKIPGPKPCSPCAPFEPTAIGKPSKTSASHTKPNACTQTPFNFNPSTGHSRQRPSENYIPERRLHPFHLASGGLRSAPKANR